MNIYRIDFEEKWSGIGDWMAYNVNVLANGDAEKAIAKARKWALRRTYNDDLAKGILRRCTGFRLIEIKLIASAEI